MMAAGVINSLVSSFFCCLADRPRGFFAFDGAEAGFLGGGSWGG